MNYSNLRSQILAAIKYPPKISAASLQEQLINIVNGLDLGALLLGVATPSLTPNTEANGFYFALQSGTYTNFPTINGQTITIDSSEVAIIVRSGNYWSKIHITTYPTIDPTTKHWMIGNEDTGVLAEGTTPHIDQESGNWMIGTYDTGIHAQGAPGKDAYQPFKGSFSSVQDLNAAYPEPNDGDTAYVEDTVENTTVLKVYDVVNGEWHDTGTTADSPMFGSGQFLSSVKIDDTHLANPADGSLPKAEDVMQLKAKLEGVTASEIKASVHEESGYVKTDGSISQGTSTHVVIALGNADKIRFLGQTVGSVASNQVSYAFWKNQTYSADGVVYSSQFDVRTGDNNEKKEYSFDLQYYKDKGAAYIAISVTNMTRALFYAYLRAGDSILDEVKLPSKLLSPAFTSIEESSISDYKINDFVITSQGLWVKRTNSYSFVIPVVSFSTIKITRRDTLSAAIAFLDGYPEIADGNQPNYVTGTNRVFIREESEQTIYIPEGTRYLYIKGLDSNVLAYPQSLKISRNPEFLGRKDVSFGLSDNDEKKVLSASVGPEIKSVIDAVQADDYISVLGGIRIKNFNIISGIWKSGDRECSLVPVGNVTKIAVVGNTARASHVGFLTDFPQNIENNESVTELISNNLAASNVVTEFQIPQEAKYIYFNVEAGNGSYLPQKVFVIERKDSKLEVQSTFSGRSYDTCIEENIFDQLTYTYYKEKTYIIDHDATYYLLGFLFSGLGSTFYMLQTYNEAGNVIDQLYPGGNGVAAEKVMEPVAFSENVHHVKVTYYLHDDNGHGVEGYGALMRVLKDDDWVPTNDIIYCCTKVIKKFMPYDYNQEGTTFDQGEEWSSWAFYMPYNYNRSRHYGVKLPIVAFFHGSSGFVTPDLLSYASSSTYDSVQGKLREKGFIVFDVNGSAIGRKMDFISRNWGNPRAIATVKKAYEVLIDRFNGRRGMVLSGISMGGALAKSYAMTYPEDVMCCALEAPSELGCSCRFPVRSNNPNGEHQQTVAAAWGYVDQFGEADTAAMYNDVRHSAMVGYSPCIVPSAISNDGSIQVIDESSMTSANIESNADKFICGFPVEIKIWHGYNIQDDVDTDTNVPYFYSKFFVETVRNANGRATLRTCPNCTHYLNNFPWVKQEVVDYIIAKMNL